MQYLGIDFGLKNIGFSIANKELAEPFKEKKYSSDENLLLFIKKICKKQKIKIIIIGLPKGKLEKKVRSFKKLLEENFKIPVYCQDESFSTYDAKQKLVQANASRKKRRQDHSKAATVILQTYIDDNVKH